MIASIYFELKWCKFCTFVTHLRHKVIRGVFAELVLLTGQQVTLVTGQFLILNITICFS